MNHTNPDLFLSEISQWHPITFLSRKMIPARTWYETHNKGLRAIIKALKTWRQDLKDYKHELLVLIDYNNLHQFIDKKSLSTRQV